MPIKYAALTAEQRHWYNKALASSHEAHTYCELWNRGRKLVRTLDAKTFPIDGQVDLQGASRTATCALFDPGNYLKLDSNLLFLDRILRVERWVRVAELDDFVKVPLFTGPVTKADAHNSEVSIEAHGFDMWLSGDLKRIRRFPRGGVVTKAIKSLLLLGGVEAKYMSIPHRNDRLPDQFQVGPKYEGGVWAAVTYLADSINCDIFPDGDGVIVLRHRPAGVAWDFRGGDSGTVVGVPQESVLIGGQGDATSLVNDCIVIGQAKPVKPPENPPDGWKPPELPVIRGEAIAKDGSRWSPNSLGFPGAPFYAKDEITLDHCRTNATAQAIAEERLRRFASTAVQVSFDAVPVPHLNPWDRITVDVDGYYQGTVYLTQCSWPFNFTESTPMTVGYRKRVHVAPPRHRP